MNRDLSRSRIVILLLGKFFVQHSRASALVSVIIMRDLLFSRELASTAPRPSRWGSVAGQSEFAAPPLPS